MTEINNLLEKLSIDLNKSVFENKSLVDSSSRILITINEITKKIKKGQYIFEEINKVRSQSFYALKLFKRNEGLSSMYLATSNFTKRKGVYTAVENSSSFILLERDNMEMMYSPIHKYIGVFLKVENKSFLFEFKNGTIIMKTFIDKKIVEILIYKSKKKQFMRIKPQATDFKNMTIEDHDCKEIGFGIAIHSIPLVYYGIKYDFSVLSLCGKKKTRFTLNDLKKFNDLSKRSRMTILINQLKEEEWLTLDDKGYFLNSEIDYIDIIDLINFKNKT